MLLWLMEKHFLDQPIKNDVKEYDNMRKIKNSQGYDYTSGCLIILKFYKSIAVDLSKQQALDSNPKAIKQINFAGSLRDAYHNVLFVITEEAKENILDFPQGIVKVL